jgi:hypothetical protein
MDLSTLRVVLAWSVSTNKENKRMKVCYGTLLAVGLMAAAAWADDIKSGPTDKTGGPFDVKAITGDQKGKQLCYV